jgi:DNA-binding transcriptional MerR regulator
MAQTWKVGAVADSSGVTVRTLHHWDEIGLLKPSRRGLNGHREYTEADLGRLYVVIVLREFGLPLDSIGACLAGGLEPKRVLTDQLCQVEAAYAAIGRLRDRLVKVVAAAGEERALSEPAELLQLMREARPSADAVLEAYLDDNQRAELASGAAAVGPALPYLLEIEWPQLYRQADDLRRKGASPSDERVQRIVGRMDELSTLVGGNRPDGGGEVRAAWRENPAAMSGETEETASPWRELADYVESARALHRAP